MAIRSALLAPALVGGILVLSTACGSSRRSEPMLGPPPLDTPQEQKGEVLYMKFCHQCHPGGAGGLGPGLNNKPAPGAAIRLQIREGVGAMPSFGDNEIIDPDVDAIIAYMLAIRSYEDADD
jgi:mono/diheme cytochrome c family protein